MINEFEVLGMKCSSCPILIKDMLHEMEGVIDVKFKKEQVQIIHDESVSETDIESTINDAGFKVKK